MSFDLNSLKFLVFNFRNPRKDAQQVKIENQVYHFWWSIWHDVFSKSNSLESLDTDDFYRQDLLKVILCQDQVVGCSFSSIFDLRNTFTKKHSYFAAFTDSAYKALATQSCNRVMTVEYLTAHPEWRKAALGVSLGALIVGLDLNLMEDIGVDASLGATRQDIKVNAFCAQFGYQTIVPQITKCNYPCELMAAYKGQTKSYPEEKTQKLIDSMWAKRNDLRSNLITNERVAA